MLEYCSPALLLVPTNWNLYNAVSLRLTGLRSLSYDERLTVLGLERLELRRIYADLTMCYKIVYGLINIPFDAFFKFADCNSTRGHPVKLLHPDARINARAHSFPVRVVSLWNRLPAATVLATNLQTFKTSIRNIDFSYAYLGKM